MSRLVVLLYGVVSYLVGVVGLLTIIMVLAHLMPWGYLNDVRLSIVSAIAWNLALVIAWGVIHTVMARPRFKAWLTRFIPEPAERSTYVLIAGLSSIALTGYWQHIDGFLWLLQGRVSTALWYIFIFGWIFLFGATFAINHFDLFGLRQVFCHFKNQPRPPLNFVKRAMYKYIRHPIQTGVLIGIWATPFMTYTQLVLSIGFTVYIFVGLWFEEQDLIKVHGDDYLEYKKEAGMVLPKF